MTFDEYNNSLDKPHSYRSLSYFAAKGAYEDGVKIGMTAVYDPMSVIVDSKSPPISGGDSCLSPAEPKIDIFAEQSQELSEEPPEDEGKKIEVSCSNCRHVSICGFTMCQIRTDHPSFEPKIEPGERGTL